MSEAGKQCLNCEAPLSGEYCSACGQRDLPSKLALGELLREVVSETFELDGRVPRTLVPFLFRPGFLTREYVAGRRVRYTSPFRLFLAATLLWLMTSFFAEQRVDFEVEAEADGGGQGSVVTVQLPGEDDNRLTALIEERGRELEKLPEAEQLHKIATAARETLPQAALLTIPIFALWLKLLFWRRDRYYVEHLVFALHVHAFAFVILGLVAPISDDGIISLGVLLIPIYLYVALWKGYEARWWTSALRLLALGLVHSVVLATTVGVLIMATVLFG